MARYLGSIQGNRNQVTRLGTPRSGISAHVRGWDIGARVTIYVNGDGKDEVTVYRTSGSNAHTRDTVIATFTE